MTDIVERLNDSLSAGYSELRKEAADEIERLRAKIEAMERQKPAGKFIQHPSNGLWEQDGYGDNPDARPLYALPGAQAQPASSIPVEAIGKMLADVMAVAVSNGANSVSMPDEYVEIAVWLQGECPAQPAPSVPDEIERDVLRACCGTFHGSRHRITCEKYKGKREPGDKP